MNQRRDKNRTECQGFTLIELLVATAILVIISLIVSEFFQKANMAWNVGSQKIEIVMKGRAAVTLMAREISQAVRLPASMVGQANTSLTNYFTSGEAGFWMLGNPDDGQRAARYVHYKLDGNTIKRQATFLPSLTAEGEKEVVEDVQKLDFTGVPAGLSWPMSVMVSITVTSESMTNRFQSAATLYSGNYDRLSN